MRAVRDALIRLVGAEPATFVPVARAYALVARRRSRLREQQTSGGKKHALSWFTPFHLTCLTTLALGAYTINAFLDRSEYLSGFILAATLGFIFVGSISLFDYFDLLFSGEEYRVLGAHPHHAWSFMVAKLVVIGRAIATLSLCFFLPSIVTVAIVLRDPVVTLAWGGSALVGAVASGAAAAVFGSTVLASGGRSALLKLLPWVQTGYLVIYFGVIMGRRPLFDVLREWIHASSAVLWLLPSAWFTAPAEWAMGAANVGTWVRIALAVGSVAAIAAVGARAARGGFGERMLLGPVASRGAAVSSRAAPSARRSRRLAGATRRPAERAFYRIALAHLRTDIGFRSQLVLAVVWPVLLFGSQRLSTMTSGFPRPGLLALIGITIPISMLLWGVSAAFLNSGRPAAIEAVLASPVDRVRFGLAPVELLRRWVLAPVLLALAVWYLTASSATGLGARTAQLAGIAAILDTQVHLNRGIMPWFPFASGRTRESRIAWGPVVAFVAGALVVGSGMMLLVVASRLGGWLWVVTGVAIAAFRIGAGWWAKRRVAKAAGSLEAV